MKWIAAVFCLLIGSYVSMADAVSLKINPGINLLVLDGHKLPSSLLKGADSIELERGQHQIVFSRGNSPTARLWILTFDTASKSVTVVLPADPASHSGYTPKFQLSDENHQNIPVIQDHLLLSAGEDYMQAISNYNLLDKKASVAKFSTHSPEASPRGAALTSDNSQSLSAQSGERLMKGSSLQALRYWLQDLRIS
ncbi:DUF2057 family protein [Tatumella saanichensis]|uniref:DUF2057 family protein n=1 Tax=Tatumella saanichensis TaxID=480813 RepID=UPI0004AC7EAF|nr:DUF2057 family protein [Tatumella saanichensis]